MFKLKYLRIGFQPEISAIELNYFRGAVIKAVNKENVLFHNHEEEGFRYGYPLIQYKRIKGKPVLVCLQEGTEQIHDFFGRKITKMQLGNRSIEISIESMNLKDITLEIGKQHYHYEINKWLALSSESFKAYKDMESNEERKGFLSRILRGNILAMAKGLKWFVKEQIEVKLYKLEGPILTDYKETKLFSFEGTFSCNINLPSSIGLGKGSAKGFGTITAMQYDED
jgi:hypothetical protein